MKHRHLLALVFVLASRTVSAHEDFYAGGDFGNVKVTILTGFEYEETQKVSKRHIMQNMDDYTPFRVAGIGGAKLAISYCPDWTARDRTLIYLIKDDALIQYLDKLIYPK
ncbi:MAG: hypothetical protein FWG50_00340 [Kiritimatiellaeota bacterium]|nr:hypothetical protein [Kiritimatiellota bacterium]